MVVLSPVEIIPVFLFTATERSPEAVATLFLEPVGCNLDGFRSRQIIRPPPNTHGAATRTHTHQDHGQCKATAKTETTIATTARMKVPVICRMSHPHVSQSSPIWVDNTHIDHAKRNHPGLHAQLVGLPWRQIPLACQTGERGPQDVTLTLKRQNMGSRDAEHPSRSERRI